ncbi:MAG: hypothetical protein ACYCOR_03680 [Acidobacteriaceae bacterium]
MTLLLRIAARSETAPVLVTGPRWKLRSPAWVRFRPIRPTPQRLDRLRPFLLWLLSFALTLGCSFAKAASDSAARIASDSAWNLAKSDPHALVQAAIQNEINNSYGHRPPMRYRLRKKTRNTDTTKEIVETIDSGVARLMAIGNQPLTPSQAQAEVQRLHALASDPATQQHRRRSEARDAARLVGVMHLLPAAFLNQYLGPAQTPDGVAIRLTFAPNPSFSPPTLESRILTGIRGEIWIDPTDLRVVRIEGHLFRTVDFGWGILGILYPGGTISIGQAKTPDCGWQLAHLNLNMNGRALMLKPLHIVVDETATDYHSVPAGWKYTDAIRWLLHLPEFPTAQVDP